jgi:hypothetical protein
VSFPVLLAISVIQLKYRFNAKAGETNAVAIIMESEIMMATNASCLVLVLIGNLMRQCIICNTYRSTVKELNLMNLLVLYLVVLLVVVTLLLLPNKQSIISSNSIRGGYKREPVVITVMKTMNLLTLKFEKIALQSIFGAFLVSAVSINSIV